VQGESDVKNSQKRRGQGCFTEGHCKPPHKRDNIADAAELSSLAARAFRFVKVGFPRSKKSEPSEKQERPFVVDGDRIYLSCVDSKNNYFFVHIDENRVVFVQSINGCYPRTLSTRNRNYFKKLPIFSQLGIANGGSPCPSK
jgi:hypothetical protein